MIDVSTNNGNIKKLHLSGNVTEISADCLIVIRAIYDAIYEQDKDCADLFEQAVKYILNDDNNKVFRRWSEADESQ